MPSTITPNVLSTLYLRAMLSDETYMQRCIDLARMGQGFVSPNPMVGAVLVHEGKIVGEGYHRRFGEAHAEVNAIASVKDPSILSECTIYVNLEPCAHHGKTPPCANLLIEKKLKRVVIGCPDPHSKVSGKGVELLKKAGIEVTLDILQQECRELNRRFITFHERQRPYVILKWAQTKDGFLDRIRHDEEVGINWITSPETKSLVHKWRSQEQSILVGRRTIQNDNPMLTVREFSGANPTRIVIDSQLQSGDELNIFSEDAPTIVFNRIKNEVRGNIEWIRIPETNTKHILDELYKRNILSVFVEGGSRTLQYFIIDNHWDEARVIVGNTTFGEGVKAPAIGKVPSRSYSFSTDTVHHYFRRWPL
jgi:diaminohydroxyphosphoribosylaminopyrimidine deaminase/5-amino-6-(5-phosphoribosylamino)uracil reductase